MRKKALVIIYESMSISEITLLTNYLTIYQPSIEDEWIIDTVGEHLKPYKTEDQFQIIPTKKYTDIDFNDYKIIILPGIIMPFEIFAEDVHSDFLKPLKTMKNRPLIASISSSPALLAKAGILDGVKFTSGLFEETLNDLDYIQKENIVRQPIVTDEKHGIITAIGFAYKEFAIECARLLGFNISEKIFSGVRKEPPYTEEELTFYMNKE